MDAPGSEAHPGGSPPDRQPEYGCKSGITLKQLRVFVAVAVGGSMSSAANELNTSRSSVTKLLKKVEAAAGTNLFVRRGKLLIVTPSGEALLAAALRALAHLEDAEKEIIASQAKGRPTGPFIHRVTTAQLRVFLAVVGGQSHTRAAVRLQVTQPAVTMAIRDLQNAVGCLLLERQSDGVRPSPEGLILADRARRALAELGELRRIDPARRGALARRIVVGVLPLAGCLLPARTIEGFLERFPGVNLTLVEGPYASLLREMRRGGIDLIIGGLSSPSEEPDIEHYPLYNEEIMAAVRTSHPLATGAVATLEQLLRFRWIVPRSNTPARRSIDHVLQTQQLSMPPSAVETNSILTTRSLLIEGDRIAFITGSQVQVDVRCGMIRTLKLGDAHPSIPVGVRTRIDVRPSETVAAFLADLRRMGLEYQHAGDVC